MEKLASSSQPVPTLSHVTAIGPLKRLTCSSTCVTSTFAPMPSIAAACAPCTNTWTPIARSPSGTSTSRIGVLASSVSRNSSAPPTWIPSAGGGVTSNGCSTLPMRPSESFAATFTR